MQEYVTSYSFSAPKILGSSNSPIFCFNTGKLSPTISPGESPSCFVIRNFPVEHSGRNKNRNYFFNSDMSLNELKKLAEIPTIEEEDDDQLSSIKPQQLFLCKSASRKQVFSPSGIKPKEKSEEKGEEQKHRCIFLGPRFVPIIVPKIILQRPPARPGNLKREKRGTFNEEMISFDRYTGLLKFYNLQKRFGFIKVDDEDFDVFICEDDMLLSGLNLRRFKDDVYKKHFVNLDFNIKKYLNSGVEKMKAIHIIITSVTGELPID